MNELIGGGTDTSMRYDNSKNIVETLSFDMQCLLLHEIEKTNEMINSSCRFLEIDGKKLKPISYWQYLDLLFEQLYMAIDINKEKAVFYSAIYLYFHGAMKIEKVFELWEENGSYVHRLILLAKENGVVYVIGDGKQ